MADSEEQTPESTKPGKKTIILMASVFIIEAVVIAGGFMLLGGPADVSAETDLAELEIPEEEKISEQLVVEGRFPNSKRGVTYLYDTEVFVQVKRRHQDQVIAELEQYKNEIKSELAAIWRTTDPHHFDEPRLENLTRKVYALMNNRFGVDAESGEPIAVKVVIVMGTGLRVDG